MLIKRLKNQIKNKPNQKVALKLMIGNVATIQNFHKNNQISIRKYTGISP
jgi:hypothetical protein